MRKLTFLLFCIVIIAGLFLSGCEKQHPVIVLPPSATVAKETPSNTVLPTPDIPMPSPSPSASEPVSSGKPSASAVPSKPAASSKPSASAVPSKSVSPSKAPTTPANVPNKITFSNAKGSATFYMGMNGKEAITTYSVLSTFPPLTNEEIDFVIDFPNDKGEYGSDGYYGGGAPTGDIDGEIELHFYNKKLNRIEVSNGDFPLVSSFSIGSVNQSSSLAELVNAFGPYESQEGYQRTTYHFSGKNNSISFTHNTNGQLIQLLFG